MKKRSITLKIVLIIIAFFVSTENIKSTTYYLQSTGAVENPLSWNTNPGGGGSTPSDFTSTSDVWNITKTIGVNASAFNPPLGASVIVGSGFNFVVTGVTSFAAAISALGSGTLSITNLNTTTCPFNFGTFSSNSTVVFNTNNFQIPLGTYPNVNIASNATLAGNLTALGTMSILATKVLTLNSKSLFLKGSLTSIAGTGLIEGDPGATIDLSIGSVGNCGTLFFSSTGRSLANFLVSYSSASSIITIGNNVRIHNGFNHTVGIIDISGVSFENHYGSDANFPVSSSNGSFRVDPSTSLSFKGSVGFYGGGTSVFFDSGFNTLKVFTDSLFDIFALGQDVMTIGNMLNITDSLSVISGALNTNGFITLKASSTLKGRVGRVGGTISGNITAETFVPGTSTGWANWGSNGVSGQAISNWASQIPMTCESCPNGVTATGSYFESIQAWNESTAGYDTTLTSATSLTSGKGFWVYVGTGLGTTSDITLSNTGNVVSGNVNVPVTTAASGTNQGFNLVSNPYASPIGWSKVLSASGGTTNFFDEIYAWNADLGGGAGAYTQHVGGLSNPGGSTGITDIIPAGQAFFVKAKSGATSLSFTELAKMDANTSSNPLLKPAASNNIGKIFRLRIKGNSDWDETAFRIHGEASASFDASLDAHKIFQSPGYVGYPGSYSKYTTISSKDAANEDYAINSLPPLSNSVSVPLLTRVSASGSYTINAYDFQDFEMCVGLIDKLDNSYHDLRLSPYVFTINDTTSAPRFELVLCKDESLNATGISIKKAESNSIFINQDAQGAYVKTAFAQNTKALISVYNVIGQKLMRDVSVEGTVTSTQLPIDLHNQVILVKVTTDKESVTKKIVMH